MPGKEKGPTIINVWYPCIVNKKVANFKIILEHDLCLAPVELDVSFLKFGFGTTSLN